MEQLYVMGNKHADSSGYVSIVGKQVCITEVDFFDDSIWVQTLDDPRKWCVHGADLHKIKDTNAEMSFLLKEEL